jgi:hypothetical protein
LKKIIISVILILAISVIVAKNHDGIVKCNSHPTRDYNGLRDSTLIFSDDFESGISSWTITDVTNPGCFWHISTYDSYDENGKSWRMGDVNIYPDGGYLDDWYQVLDTPIITLPTDNLTISFQQKRAIEALGDHENFDGWDGLNVRIRLANQDYDEAEILTSCTPAYNSSSMYGFGYQHEEDIDGIPGIPGWGGSTDWTQTMITIPSNYANEDVIISFAFASDPNTSTATNPEFTGIFIDEINIADVLISNCDEANGFSNYTNTPIGGDLWHLYETELNSVMGCFDAETNLYNPNMQNYLKRSCTIFRGVLPDDLDDVKFFLDMDIKSELDDFNFPNCDYFSIEVQHYIEGEPSAWHSVSNPTGDPDGMELVFTGSQAEFVPFSFGWLGFNELTELFEFDGEDRIVLKFRIGFHSNDVDEFSGIQLDNFRLFYTQISPTDVVEEELAIADYELANYPNPFCNTTTISFNLNANDAENVELMIYNIKGQLVKQLAICNYELGINRVNWNAQSQASGIYFYKLVVDGKPVEMKKMILIK